MNEEYIVEHAVNTQKAIILEALRNGETLTPMKAISRWWITKLATRISELKRDLEGTDEMIITEMQYQREFERDENGNYLRDENGNFVMGKITSKYAAYHLEKC